jgi:hypothetical protein
MLDAEAIPDTERRNTNAMPIDQDRQEEILQLAEDRATDDADSLYPLAEESEGVLLVWGQRIARELGFADKEATLFASTYASLYRAEIDCLDQDYEPQDGEESGFIAARRIRLADLNPLAIFHLWNPVAERDYDTYRQARRAYNASRRTHGSALLSLERYLDVNHERQHSKITLLVCGSFKQRMFVK